MKSFLYSAARRLLAAALILTFIIPQLGCEANPYSQAAWQGVSKDAFYLDTLCRITVYGMQDEDGSLAAMDEAEQEKTVQLVITDAFRVCDRYEKLLSKTKEESEIAQINRAQGAAVTVSDDTLAVLKKGLAYGQRSEGAFDITIGKASKLWNFHDIDENHHAEAGLPDATALAEAIQHVDYQKVKIDGHQVQLEDPEMEIDLGGIAKGYIADRVAAFLEENGVNSAVINLGGNIVTLGGKAPSLLADPTTQTDFSISIVDPTGDGSTMAGTFLSRNQVIVTSGTYERYVVEDGVRYHHILDVQTGWPVETDLLSATIVAGRGQGADADALSTICLTKGMDDAMKLLAEQADVEGILIDTDGRLQQTDGAPKLQ